MVAKLGPNKQLVKGNMITGFNSEKKLTKNKLNVSFKKSITFFNDTN